MLIQTIRKNTFILRKTVMHIGLKRLEVRKVQILCQYSRYLYFAQIKTQFFAGFFVLVLLTVVHTYLYGDIDVSFVVLVFFLCFFFFIYLFQVNQLLFIVTI